MSSETNERKIEHISIVNSGEDVDRRRNHFDALHLVHRALPEVSLSELDPSVTFLGKRLSFPLFISSMTGGDHELIRRINRNLARAAERAQVGMGVGSQRVMFEEPQARASFELRDEAPTALLFANLGAVQLNYGMSSRECREAVAVVDADALVLHLNPLQEVVQREGNTNFAGLAEKVGRVREEIGRPVIVKEVGSGISPADVRLALEHGVTYFDVAGSGGTSWSRVEYERRQPKRPLQRGERGESNGEPRERAHELVRNDHGLGLTFQDWGIPTPLALEMLEPMCDRITLVASGGIRTGIDIAKALILGASLCGIAAPFLRPAMESAEAVVEEIERLRREFVTTMFLLGVKNVSQLHRNRELLLDRSIR